MSCIVCATRGGEGSRAVQLAAIRRSQETGLPLIFLFVSDPASLGELDDTLVPAVQSELDWMGHALLRVAQQRAERAGQESEVVIRQGRVQEQISRFLEETRAEMLMLGAPRGTSANVFGDDAIEQFAMAIEESSGIAVQVVRPESLDEDEAPIMDAPTLL